MNYKSILKQGNEYLESLTTLFSLISSISRWALHQVNETNNIREIKHRVYGKRERQKYHVITSFPPFFTFAVCRFQREEACSRVHQQREYFFKVFYSFCYNFQPVFKPSDVLFIFLRKLTGLLSAFTQKGRKKCAGKWADVWLSTSQRLSTVLWKRRSNYAVRQTSQGNHIQQVTDILVKS